MDRSTALARLDAFPLVAILRGVRADEVVRVATALVDEGFTTVEVPLSGPGAMEAVRALARGLGHRATTGAGTVTTPAQVVAVRATGGVLVVSPHLDEGLVSAARATGLVVIPGVATPTEAFRALAAGADALKLFPGEAFTPAVVRAWRVVLPPPARLLLVGGVTAENLGRWRAAGIDGAGLGTALYRPGDDPQTVAKKARALRLAWETAG